MRIRNLRKVISRDTEAMLCHAGNPPRLDRAVRALVEQGWKIVVADQRRGHCFFGSKSLITPLWAWKLGTQYYSWYLSHEVAHACVGKGHNHDQIFMSKLKELCPTDALHFELGYKPRAAKKAGIKSSTRRTFEDTLKPVAMKLDF